MSDNRSGDGRKSGAGFTDAERPSDDRAELDASANRDALSPGLPRYSRRLSDKILIAFHHACDQADFEIAEALLQLLELMLTRRPLAPDGNRRRSMESLVAAHERLWHLRHPGDDQF